MRTIALSLVFAAMATGCGHAAMRGHVVMKVDPTTAHVCLGKGEVAVNDPVRLYKNICEASGKRAACRKEAVGDGKVTELLDDHYSVVTFPAGTPFEEGFTVEKVK